MLVPQENEREKDLNDAHSQGALDLPLSATNHFPNHFCLGYIVSMKLLAIFFSFLFVCSTFATLPPFLFTPGAKEIKQFGSGYSITMDNGQSLSVDRFGLDYRITTANRVISTYSQTTDGWVEKPSGRVWRLGPDGKWRTAAGDMIISRVITDIVLQQAGRSIKWRENGTSWIRQSP